MNGMMPSTLGMWHETQPFAGSTGQARAATGSIRMPAPAPGGAGRAVAGQAAGLIVGGAGLEVAVRVVAGDAVEPAAALGRRSGWRGASVAWNRMNRGSAGGITPSEAWHWAQSFSLRRGGGQPRPRDRRPVEAGPDRADVVVARPVAPLAADPPVGRLGPRPALLGREPRRVTVQAVPEAIVVQ